ncbi:hypothetical protein FRB99_005999 [Tulasnella sp. 403]|nr:hypothetical protein FRB99_005999 [Tulasnella sp. 403]
MNPQAEAKELVSRIVEQERTLRFPRFSSVEAFEIGSAIRERFLKAYDAGKYPDQGIVIAISTFTGHTMFVAAAGDENSVGPIHWKFVEGKKDVIRRNNHSSFYAGRKAVASGREPEEFAFGGGFPVWLTGCPSVPIASIVVSGLQQEDDHQLIVDVLSEYIPKLDPVVSVGALKRQWEELSAELARQIKALGGHVLGEHEDDIPWRIFLYEPRLCDPQRLFEYANRDGCICLQWDWVLQCYDQGKFLGPLDDDFGGFRYALEEPTVSSFDPHGTLPLPPDQPSPTYSPSEALTSPTTTAVAPSSRFQDVPHFHSPTPATSSCSPLLASKQLHTGRDDTTSEEKRIPKRRRRTSSQEDEPARSKQRRLYRGSEETATRASVTSGSDLDGTSLPRSKSPRVLDSTSRPPTPPTKVVRSGWFGMEYTDEDREYLKKYVAWFCNKEYDPDFKKMFREMASHAPHHKSTGWEKFFYREERKLAKEIPALKCLYEESSSDDEPSAGRKGRRKPCPSWKSPERPKSSANDLNVSEADRRALIKFMAEAPEAGVTQEELLQNFAHFNTSFSWRTWQRLIRENRASFDRAVAKKRAQLKAAGQ